MPRPTVLLLVLSLLAAPARATWSIVVVDSASGEVVVASATCLELFDLAEGLPVVRVGLGGAAAQSSIDVGATNRMKIWDALAGDHSADEIIEIAKDGDLFKCSRQYGVVTFDNTTDSFSGACVIQHKGRRNGTLGSVSWAIQGNILTGAPVLDAAEWTLLNTPGTLTERVMRAMEAAASLGGDGRCSCDLGPTECGSPPSQPFDVSATTGFLITARMGDVEGVCNGFLGCANGDYFLRLNAIGDLQDPDPVWRLRQRYEQFKASKVGRPDGLLSLASWDLPVLPGDGVSVAELHVQAVDLNGDLVTTGGATVEVEHAPDSAGLSPRQVVVDHGDVSYSVRVLAGLGPGTDRFIVRFRDETGPASLWPFPELDYTATR